MMLKIINWRFAKRVRAGVTAGEGSSEPGRRDIRGAKKANLWRTCTYFHPQCDACV